MINSWWLQDTIAQKLLRIILLSVHSWLVLLLWVLGLLWLWWYLLFCVVERWCDWYWDHGIRWFVCFLGIAVLIRCCWVCFGGRWRRAGWRCWCFDPLGYLFRCFFSYRGLASNFFTFNKRIILVLASNRTTNIAFWWLLKEIGLLYGF